MVILETGEKLKTDETLSVFSGGTFSEQELVLVIKDGDEIPFYQYPANFIKFGEIDNGE